MKKLFLFLVATVCSLTMSARMIYLDTNGPGYWGDDNPAFFIWSWGGSGDYSSPMTPIEGNLFYGKVPDDQTHLLFVRMPEGYTKIDWDNKIDHTIDYDIPTDGNNLFTITGWEYGKAVGNWTTFVEPAPTCMYTLVMRSYYGEGWFGGYLTIEDKGVEQRFEMGYTSYETASVFAYGGTPVVKWHDSEYNYIVSYYIYDANGVLIGGHDRETEFVDIELPDPCAERENIYAVTGLEVERIEGDNYLITWDANDNVEKYSVQIFNPENNLIHSVMVYGNSWTQDMSYEFVSGDYRVVVTPCNSDGETYCLSTELTFPVVMEDLGEVSVRVLIPSDSEVDITKGVKIIIINPNWSEEMIVDASREGDSRWWSATPTLNITGYACRAGVGSGTDEQYWTWATELTKSKEVCFEFGTKDFDESYDGVQYHYYYDQEISCDTEDHNYNIASATLTGGEGTLSVSITPEGDAAYRYRIWLYTDDGKYYDDYSFYGTSAEFTFESSEDIVFTSWIIRPMNENWNFVGQEYHSKASETVTVKALPALGEVTFNVLIPSDCCFDVSPGVWFTVYAGSTVQYIEATEIADRWYSATFTVPAPSYTIYVVNKDVSDGVWEGTNSAYIDHLTELESYYSVRNYYSNDGWYLRQATSDMHNHNYVPTDASISVDTENAQFTVTLTSDEWASYYYIYLYKEGESNVYASYYMSPYESERLGTTCSRTFNSSCLEETTFTRFEVRAFAYENGDEYRVCEYLASDVTFTIPASKLVPQNLAVEDNGDNTFTLSWDVNDAICEYDIHVNHEGKEVQYWYIYKGDREPVDGRYSVVFDRAVDNGTYSFIIRAYDCESYNYCGSAEEYFEVTGLKGLGEVTIRLLVPTDSEMDISNGIWLWWWNVNEDGQWQEAKSIGGRWFEATVTATKPSIQFLAHTTGIWGGEYRQTNNSPSIMTNEACLEVTYGNEVHFVDCDMEDHDYRITNVDVDNSKNGKLIFTITAKDYTSYNIYYRVHDSGSGWSYLVGGTPGESHSLSATVYNLEDVVYDYRIEVYVEDYWYYVAAPYEGVVEVPANRYIPQNLEAKPNGHNTYLLGWDISEEPASYRVSCYDSNDNSVLYETFYIDELIVDDGKYWVETAPFAVAGTANFYVTAYDEEGSSRGYSYQYFDVTLSDLGDFTQRVQIPSDLNMNIENGVWMCWWLEDESSSEIVKMTETADRWFEADLNIPALSFKFYILNSSVLTDETSVSEVVESHGECYSLRYNTNPKKYNWELYTLRCDAPDHDFRITNVIIDNSKGGTLVITPEAKDIALAYWLYYRVAGEEEWLDAGYWFPEEGLTRTVKFSNTEAIDFEFAVLPYDFYGYICADSYEGTGTVLPNTDLPQNMKAVVGDDGRTVTFTWTPGSGDAAFYDFYAIDMSNGWYRAHVSDITENTLTTTLYVPSKYYWTLDVYDKDYNWLGEATGPEFTTTGPDLTPTNLDVSVNGQTATLSWTTPSEVKKSYYYVEGYNFNSDYTAVYSTNGQFTATFTPPVGVYGEFEWGVVSAVDGDTYFISNWAYGDDFVIEEPDVPVTETCTITISSGPGGYVNNGVNGTYPLGTPVTITATPYQGYAFAGWSDGDNNLSRVIVLVQDTNLVASFVSTTESYTLELKAGEGGTVNSSEANGEYPAGSKVTIVATPNDGYEFDRWSDGDTKATREIIISQDSILTAYFVVPMPEQTTYTLHISSAGGGKVNEEVNGTYEPGDQVMITATPNTGWDFANWSDGNTSASRTITMDKNYDLVAYFTTTEEFAVKITAGEGGKLEPDNYSKKKYVTGGTVIEVEAVPDEDYNFVGWSDGVTTAKRQIVIVQDTDLVAEFEEIEYVTLTVKVNPAGTATVYFDKVKSSNNMLEVEAGTVVTLSFDAADGYELDYWEDGKKTSDSDKYKVTVDADKTVTLHMREIPEDIRNIEAETTPVKVLRNGTIFILREGRIYTITGGLVE